jgi:hypothetical protein
MTQEDLQEDTGASPTAGDAKAGGQPKRRTDDDDDDDDDDEDVDLNESELDVRAGPRVHDSHTRRPIADNKAPHLPLHSPGIAAIQRESAAVVVVNHQGEEGR